MYCRNCGQEISDNAIACPKCGANPRTEKNFCPNCGVATAANQIMCTNCGTSLAVRYPAQGYPAVATDNSKTVAILAHITFIGWLVAIILNSQNRTEFGSYHVRNMLGLIIFNIIAGFLSLILIGWLVLLFNFVVWIMSLINAINNKTAPLPVYGDLFQNWFKRI